MEKMSEVCVAFVESDIARLSQRRRELLKELSHVEAAMQERSETLKRVKLSLGAKAAARVQGSPKRKGSSKANDDMSAATASTAALSIDVSDEAAKEKVEPKLSYLSKRSESDESDEDLSDPEVFAALLRDEVDALLFSVDRSDADEVVVYLLPQEATADIVSAHRAAIIDDKLSVTRLGAYEWMVAYGAKVVANHEREEPQTTELPTIGGQAEDPMGVLAGAIEVPCAPDVVIDVWKIEGDQNIVWATTSINGVAFCQLERISLKSETHWGLSSVVRIVLHGKHPFTGEHIEEVIDMGADEED